MVRSTAAGRQGCQRGLRLQEVMKRMAACQEHLKEHRVELDGVSKKKAALLAQLDQVFDEAHPQREALVAIFKRKIKRSKKAAAESEEESSGDEEGDDEDYDDDDDAQELCPPGCEQACYDEARPPAVVCVYMGERGVRREVSRGGVQVCALREQRLDQEDVVADITRACDAAKKEHELLKQKAKRIDQAQAATEADIEAFQREKQAALNEIEVTVLLRAHQIEHLVGGRLPTDLSGALVFSNAELARLARRIDVRRRGPLCIRAGRQIPIEADVWGGLCRSWRRRRVSCGRSRRSSRSSTSSWRATRRPRRSCSRSWTPRRATYRRVTPLATGVC